MSVSPHDDVHLLCFKFLDRTRNIVMGWIYEVVEILHSTEKENELRTLAFRILDLALTCHATFDVDARHLPKTLESSQNVSILIECAINIHDSYPANNNCVDESLKSQLRTFQRRAHYLEPALQIRILADAQGINSAVRRLWSAYESSAGWSAL